MLFLDNLKKRLSKQTDFEQSPTHRDPERPAPDTSEQELVAGFRQMVNACWAVRDPFTYLWTYCVAFLRGDQWRDQERAVRSSFRRTDSLPPAVENARITDNQLPIYYNKHLSYFRLGMPQLRAEATPDEDGGPVDRELAKLQGRLATRLLERREEVDYGNEAAMRMSAVRQMELFGEIQARVQWDPDAGKKGDVSAELVNVFGCLKDPYSIWLESVGRPPRFLIEMDCRHVDEIHDLFGIWVTPEGGLTERTQYYDMMAVNVGQHGMVQARPPMPDAAMVYRIFFSPCQQWPEGQCFIMVGDQIPRRHKLQDGRWPFARAVWEQSEFNLYGVGLIERLLSDQVPRNILRSVGFETALIKARGDFYQSGPDVMPREDVYNKRTNAKRILVPPMTTIVPRDPGMNFRDAEFELRLIDDNMHEKAALPRPSLGQPLDRAETLGAQRDARGESQTESNEKVEEFGEQFLVPIANMEIALWRKYRVTGEEIDMGPGQGKFTFRGKNLSNVTSVRAIVVPHMSVAQKRNMVMSSGQAGLDPPYPNARAEVNARNKLLYLGLDEHEASIAESHGPLEDKVKIAEEEWKVAYEIGLTQADLVLMKMKMEMEALQSPQPQPGAGQGQIGPGGQGQPEMAAQAAG